MKTYSVELVRRVISRASIEVEAESVADATEKALKNCSYIDDFSEEDDVTDITHVGISE